MRKESGQFIPMTLAVILAVVVFTMAIINVARVARNKLLVQNLADAIALYEASTMGQSMNKAADNNEWMNHLYAPSNPNQQNDPCASPSNGEAPKGIGCYALSPGHAQRYAFADKSEAVAYARLIHSVNQIQELFAKSYNGFLGASGGAVAQNSAPLLTASLYRDFPILREDASIRVFIYNSKQGKRGMESKATNHEQEKTPSNAPTSSPQPATIEGLSAIQELKFEIKDVAVWHFNPTPLGKGKATPTTLGKLLGQNKPVGYFTINPTDLTNMQFDNGKLGAGAIVLKRVSLIGLPSIMVRAQGNAYMVMKSGGLEPFQSSGQSTSSQDPLPGSFLPTYWIKLGK